MLNDAEMYEVAKQAVRETCAEYLAGDIKILPVDGLNRAKKSTLKEILGRFNEPDSINADDLAFFGENTIILDRDNNPC